MFITCVLLFTEWHLLSVKQGVWKSIEVLLLQDLLSWTKSAKANSESTAPVQQGVHSLISHGYTLLDKVQGERKPCAHPLRWQTLQLLSKSSNTFLAIQQCQISFCPSSLFVQFISRSTSQLQTLSSKWASSHIWSWLEVYSGFFFPFHKKEIKYTWPGMLLMFLPINLSISSVGYWIRYTFLCSNKLFKFLNIKGSKRKKFNFHRRDWKWHHKIPLDQKKPFLKLNPRL